MVTNKTRLLSALMAILMLVSLFTGFVLPVTAAEATKPDMPTLSEYHLADADKKATLLAQNKAFEVSSLLELELLSYYQASFTKEYTVYISANIEFPQDYEAGDAVKGTAYEFEPVTKYEYYGDYHGDNATHTSGSKTNKNRAFTLGAANFLPVIKASFDGCYAPNGRAVISGLVVDPAAPQYATGWLGAYKGTRVANLTFYKCESNFTTNTYTGILAGDYRGPGLTVENVSMVECSFTSNGTTSGTGCRGSALIGRGYSGNITFNNIVLSGNKSTGIGRQNHGFLMGYTSAGCVYTVNKIISIDNYMQISHNSSVVNYSPLIAEMNGTFRLTDAIVLNNTVSSNHTKALPIICGLTKASSEVTLKNVVAANNATQMDALYQLGADTTVVPSNTHVYAAYTGSETTTEMVTSGEVAWMLNKNTTTGVYWTMATHTPELDAGEGYEGLTSIPAFSSDGSDRTIKVIVKVVGVDEDRVLYVDLNQADIDVAHEDLLPETATYTCEYGSVTNGKLTLSSSAKDAADLTIEVNGSGKPNKAALEQKINEIGEDAKFYLKGDVMLSETTDMSDAQAVVENDNATVTDVANALEKLEAYTRVTVDDKEAKDVQIILNLDVFNEDITVLLTAVNNAFAMPETDGKAIVAKNAALANAVTAFNAAALTVKSGAKVPHKYYENELFVGVKDWLITDSEDWKTLVGRGAEAFTDESVTLTNDIDFKGDTIDPLVGSYNKKTYLNINGNGYGFKNVTIKIALIYGYYYGSLSDFHLDDTCKIVSTSDRHAASFVTRLYGTLKNCWSEAYIKHTGEGYDERVGGLVGEHAGGLIDGCYFAGTIECADDYQVAAISDWYVDQTHNSFAKPTYVIPEGIEGKSNGVSAPGLFRGRIHTYYQTYPDLIKNTYGVGVAAIYQNADYVVTPIYTNSGVEYDARDLWNYNEMQKATNDEYANGALAWKLTANSTHKGTDEVTYYTVKDGKTVHAKSADDQMRRITLKQGEVEYYAYVVNKTAFTYGGNEYVADQDLVINVDGVLPTEHTIVRTDVGTGSHIETCTAEGIVIAEGIVATCGLKELKACTYDIPFDIPATCTEDGKKGTLCACGHVGTEEKTDDKTGHDMRETTPEDPAKCEVPGTTAILTCANGCGKTEGGETIPALEHDMQLTNEEEPAQCEEPGKTALYTCANGCGKTEGGIEIPKLGHDYDYENGIKTEPTVEEAGKIEYICRNGCNIPEIVILDKLAGLEITAEALEANNPLVKVDVKLLNYGAKEVTLKVNYDYINMTLTETDVISTHFTVVAFSAENGVAEIKLMADADVGADEVVATLNFKLKEKAYNGEYKFNATAEGVNLAGDLVAYEPAEEKTANVTWRVDKVDGDLNIDGNVDLLDAILLMRYINNELPEEYQTIVTDEMADLTDVGDGTEEDDIPNVNVDDVIHLLRYLNGWIDTLK